MNNNFAKNLYYLCPVTVSCANPFCRETPKKHALATKLSIFWIINERGLVKWKLLPLFFIYVMLCVIGLRSARGDKHRTCILCLKKALLPPLDEYFPVKLHLLRIFSNISTCLFIDDVSNALYLNISWQSDALCNMSLNMNMSKDSAGVCFTLSRDITHYAIAK